ncbi:hypothetical protein ACMD2_16592 [Ananas comosus]|uniref:VASt domain-containing protein n=1 Tax=Ananas comosus TaxID=4615 RepID=A0A199W260_ANACO|nr:hypothetical protein ACMD2_16592 [Ananas comosus]
MFSPQVIVPLEDIDEIRWSQHACINPAITIVLHIGAGGHGVPPLCSSNGRVKYKFTSFWNRNRAFKALQDAVKKYRAILEAEKQVYETLQQAHDVPFGSYFEIHSRWSIRTSSTTYCMLEIKIGVNMKKWCIVQSRIKSGATEEMGIGRVDWIVGTWTSFGYQRSTCYPQDGRVKYKFTSFWNRNRAFKALQDAVKKYRAILEAEKQVYETLQQAHDVPFGSYFEIHSRWSIRTSSTTYCMLEIKIGVNMKKWCIVQSRIKSGATEEV